MADFSKKGIKCQIFEFLINKRLDFRIYMYIRTHDEGSCTVEDFQKGPYRRRCLFYNFVLHAIRENVHYFLCCIIQSGAITINCILQRIDYLNLGRARTFCDRLLVLVWWMFQSVSPFPLETQSWLPFDCDTYWDYHI